jgi:hypothetical protein
VVVLLVISGAGGSGDVRVVNTERERGIRPVSMMLKDGGYHI